MFMIKADQQYKSDQTLDWIREQRTSLGLTINRLAKLSNVWEKSLRNMDDPSWNPHWKTVQKVEKGLVGYKSMSNPRVE